MASKLYGDKDKKKGPTFKTRAEALQYQADLKAPISKVKSKTATPTVKKKKLMIPKSSRVKTQGLKGKDGNLYKDGKSLMFANRKWDSKTPRKGDIDKRTGLAAK